MPNGLLLARHRRIMPAPPGPVRSGRAFGGLIFIVAASVLLPATRHGLTAAGTPVAA